MARNGPVAFANGGAPTATVGGTGGAIYREALRRGAPAVLGAFHGVEGLIEDQFLDLKRQENLFLSLSSEKGGTPVGTIRKDPTKEECGKIVGNLAKNNIRVLFMIGGDDTARAAMEINTEAKRLGYDLVCLHVAKTIDNDLLKAGMDGRIYHDHTPGFGSAALYVIQAAHYLQKDLDSFHPGRVLVLGTMGRHNGSLAASSAVLKNSRTDGPHMVLVPEKELKFDEFAADAREKYNAFGRLLIVVSEGVWMMHEGKKRLLADLFGGSSGTDSFGNFQLSRRNNMFNSLAQLAEQATGAKDVISMNLSYLQRAPLGIFSTVDACEAEKIGTEAVRYALDGVREGSVALLPVSQQNNGRITHVVPLDEVGAKKSPMQPEFLDDSPDGCGINVAGIKDYVLPLIGGPRTVPKMERLDPIFYTPPMAEGTQ